MGIYVVMMKEESSKDVYSWPVHAYMTETDACSAIAELVKEHNVEYMENDFATYEENGVRHTLSIDWCPLG